MYKKKSNSTISSIIAKHVKVPNVGAHSALTKINQTISQTLAHLSHVAIHALHRPNLHVADFRLAL